jgi:hypothetical protein
VLSAEGGEGQQDREWAHLPKLKVSPHQKDSFSRQIMFF